MLFRLRPGRLLVEVEWSEVRGGGYPGVDGLEGVLVGVSICVTN